MKGNTIESSPQYSAKDSPSTDMTCAADGHVARRVLEGGDVGVTTHELDGGRGGDLSTRSRGNVVEHDLERRAVGDGAEVGGDTLLIGTRVGGRRREHARDTGRLHCAW